MLLRIAQTVRGSGGAHSRVLHAGPHCVAALLPKTHAQVLELAAQGTPQLEVLVLPGNPGAAGYYTPFMRSLQASLLPLRPGGPLQQQVQGAGRPPPAGRLTAPRRAPAAPAGHRLSCHFLWVQAHLGDGSRVTAVSNLGMVGGGPCVGSSSLEQCTACWLESS